MKDEKYNPYLRKSILEVVDDQLKENSPPETKKTYERLLKEGHSKENAKILIASVILTEMYHTMKEDKAYNEERFIRNLNQLPDQNFD
jgi:Zn/Cd-binding protein ZinT